MEWKNKKFKNLNSLEYQEWIAFEYMIFYLMEDDLIFFLICNS